MEIPVSHGISYQKCLVKSWESWDILVKILWTPWSFPLWNYIYWAINKRVMQPSLLLTLVQDSWCRILAAFNLPCHDPWRREKKTWFLFSHLFVEGLHKTFFEAPQRRLEVKISINFSFNTTFWNAPCSMLRRKRFKIWLLNLNQPTCVACLCGLLQKSLKKMIS